MRESPIDLSGIGSLHSVARGAVDSDTMAPPTTLSSPPPDLSMEKLPDNLDSESAVGTDSDAGIKDPMTPLTTLSSPPPMENLLGNHNNGCGVGTGSDAGNKDPMTPPTTLSSPPPMENLLGNHDNGSGVGTGSDAGNKETMTPPTTLASPPPTIPMDYFLQDIVLVNETGGHTTHHHGNLATMMPTPIPIQMPPPYMSMGYLAGNLYHVDESAVGTGFDAGNKAIMMPPPTPILNPPPYLPTGNLPDLYIVNGSAVGTVSFDKKGTVIQENAVPMPRPKLLRVRSKFYIANPLVISSKTVVGTDMQKTQTPQEAVLMPQQVLMVERDPRDANIFKEIPITEKGSALGTKKKKVKLTSQKESKIDLDQHVKSGKHEVISSATGNFLMATTKTVRCTRREAKMNIKQRNDDYLLLRFLLNMGNLVMLIGFLNCMHDVIASIVNPEPRVATFLSVKFRFFIIWMVILHIFYSGTDLTLMFYYNNEKIRTGTRNVLPIMNKLKHLIDCLFRSILWPCSLLTSIFYWSMYTYDKMLTFPAFIGPAIYGHHNNVTGVSAGAEGAMKLGSPHNIEMIAWFVYEFFHTWLSLFVVMDMLCRPRIRPISFAPDLRVLYSFLFLYMIAFYYTVIVDGVWLDPCLASAYESGMFTFINLNILFLISCHTYYFALWRVNYYVHKRRLFFKNETSYFEIR